MALTSDTIRVVKSADKIQKTPHVVANGSTVYAGSLVSVNSSGRVQAARADGLPFGGVATSQVTGDSTKKVVVEYGHLIKVASSSLTAGHIGKNVALSDDNKVTTYTVITASTNSSKVTPVGELVALSGSDAWVRARVHAAQNRRAGID